MLAIVVAVIVTMGVLASSSPPASTSSLPPYRLPGDVVPQKYNLHIVTDLENFKFNGNVDIQVECKSATDTVKLHAVALEIGNDHVTLKQASDNKEVTVNNVDLDTENDFLVIKLAEKLTPNTLYRLHIPFKGELTDILAGYYRSSYTVKSSNTKEWLAVTHFEPTDARRAFPCFDEPAMKAKFTISLGHKEGLTAISNMPVANTKTVDGLIWDEFQETVPMSTYLVAFMVSKFKFRESDPEPNNEVLFRVWAREEAIDQVEFTRKYGPKFLSFLEDFFMIPYPLPKQDNVALPDFSMGAMENWGLITYRESSLLVDEKVTAASTTYYIANTVAHELSHQWFGNLVTMKWWTDLWLNEGFATYVSSLAVKNQFPDWNSYNIDVSSNLYSVFTLDALESSHPVSVPIGHPNKISQIFDTISYKKGSLVLHMMNSFLGEDVFQAGVKAYLEEFKYGNSEQNDLWNSLTTAAQGKGVLPKDVTVNEVMDKWTLQTGYPVLTMKRDGGKITLTQKRFLALKPESGKEPSGCWWIPLTYSTAKTPDFKNTKSSHWLSCENKEITVDTGAGKEDWIILNNKASGIYRVNYDTHSWEVLIKALNDKTEIDELNKYLLVADAMALAHIGELDYTTAFKVLKHVQSETAYIPWRAALIALENIENILWRTEKYEQYKKLVQALLVKVYEEKFSDLESMPENYQDNRHKLVMVYWACKNDVGNCGKDANNLFQKWMKNSENNPVPKDLRSTVYCKGVKEGGEKEWNYIWKQYESSNIASEKSTFLKALSCTKNETLLNRLLEMTLDKSSGIRLQDCNSVFYYVASESQQCFDIAKAFFEKNIQKIHDYYKPNTQELGLYVKAIVEKLVHRKEVDEMKKFFQTHQKLFEKSKLSVEQSLETAESNIVWMEAFYRNIDQALSLEK